VNSAKKIQQTLERVLSLLNKGQMQKARALCHQVLAMDGRNPDALHLLGLAWRQEGRLDEGIRWMRAAVSAKPVFFGAWYNLADTLVARGDLEEAESCYRRAIDINPAFAEAHNNLGNLYLRRRALAHARAEYEAALAARPGYMQALDNLGVVLRGLGELDAAEGAHRRVIAAEPRNLQAHLHLGNLLMQRRQFAAAAAQYREALVVDAGAADAGSGLGNALSRLGLVDESLSAYRHAVAVAPDNEIAQSNLLLALNYDASADARVVYEAHHAWGRRMTEKTPRMPPRDPDCTAGRPLRIGYVSADLRQHPVAFLLEPVLANHDRSSFEIHCYADVADGDEVTDRLRKLCTWLDVAGQTDEQLASLIRDDQIDILVDLAGHTGGNRLPMFARKPAPVQVSWLGYFNTTGLPAMDYLLTDGYLTPPDFGQPFVESLIRLPHSRFCYRPPAYAPKPAAVSRDVSAQITFGSFNRLEKVNESVIRLWVRVLDNVPGSRLLLKAKVFDDPAGRNYWLQRFQSFGLGADRLVLSGYSPHADMLAEYAAVDIALDTFPFTGGLTTLEALWMGTPVVTFAMQTMVGRQSLAILKLIGLDDCVAYSEAEYIEAAIRLAGNPQRLQALRVELRQHLQSSPLCDEALFTRDVERAFREMWRRQCAQADA